MNIIKAIINDFKKDYDVIKRLFKGELELTEEHKEVFTEIFNPKEWFRLFKADKFYFLVILLAFTSGILMSSQYYENKANSFILDFCVDEPINPYSNFTFNLTSMQKSHPSYPIIDIEPKEIIGLGS